MSPESYFKEAGKEAKKSLCLRDKCGAVVVLNNEVIGRGFSGPAGGISERKCELTFSHSKKPKSDVTCCVHAEWRAIIEAIRNRKDISGSTLYFTRVDEKGNLLKSGEPYCTVCSRLALDSGVKFFALCQEVGIKLFETKEYNDISYQFHLKS